MHLTWAVLVPVAAGSDQINTDMTSSRMSLPQTARLGTFLSLCSLQSFVLLCLPFLYKGSQHFIFLWAPQGMDCADFLIWAGVEFAEKDEIKKCYKYFEHLFAVHSIPLQLSLFILVSLNVFILVYFFILQVFVFYFMFHTWSLMCFNTAQIVQWEDDGSFRAAVWRFLQVSVCWQHLEEMKRWMNCSDFW